MSSGRVSSSSSSSVVAVAGGGAAEVEGLGALSVSMTVSLATAFFVSFLGGTIGAGSGTGGTYCTLATSSA